MSFVHLHSHFWGSYSDSVLSITEGLDRAAALGQRAMAITDHGELAFAPQFHAACRERGMNPLPGCECYFVQDARDSIARGDEFRNHLILIAKNFRGYRNLVRLTSDAWLDNCLKGVRGLVDWELLERYHEGLICMSGCYYGSFPLKIIREGLASGERELERYLSLFGDDFYPEMSELGFPEQKISNAAIIELAPRFGLKPVVTNDVHYPHPEDWLAHDIIAKTRFGKVTDFSVVTKTIWLKSLDEMRALGFDERYLHTSGEVAEKCDVRFPAAPVAPPVVYSSAEEDLSLLERRAMDALRSTVLPAEVNRVETGLRSELDRIAAHGLAGYWLAVAEAAEHSRQAGGRAALTGSGAGGALARLLGLAPRSAPGHAEFALDRFINLTIECPDPEASIGFLTGRFGEDRICRVAETVPIRGGDALRFTAEIIGVPAEERERGLAGCVPEGRIADNLSSRRALRDLCAAHPNVLKYAGKIEGIPRTARASGESVVVTGGPLRELLPLKRQGKVVYTQYDATNSRLAGFLTLSFTRESASPR
ncbi:MAG: PHP domain-containing protein [Candidatus Aureabacteria bacterium]|nr:PHP domain-containing protein [Candidatus Auribacterota bacterium]